jgi:biopolymer transport protein ExbD
MRLTNRRHGSKLDLQMTSMIDCVFLLLIFFMVTSSFNRAERELDAGLASQSSSAKAAADLTPIVVEIVRGDGGFVFKLGGRQLTSREELTDVLRKIENKLDGAFVRAEDDAPFLMAASAIQACKDAGILKTVYATIADSK